MLIKAADITPRIPNMAQLVEKLMLFPAAVTVVFLAGLGVVLPVVLPEA